MRILSFDWATKKALAVYDSQINKVKEIPNQIEAFEEFLKKLDKKVIMLFEFGGADTLKIMSFRAGHTVLQVPGKKIKDYRDSKGEEKTSDARDAELIYEFYMDNGGSVRERMRNSTRLLPSPFYPFTEVNADIAEVKILFREHEDLKKDMVREKLKRIAFERKFKIANVSGDRIKKMLSHKDDSIVAKEKGVEQIKKELKKKVEKFDIWNEHLKDIKGVGEVIASGLIGELGGRQFDGDNSLKHYAGMVAKTDFHNYNRYLKMILYQFAECIIRARTPKWRELYDNMKLFYAKKHSDWSKGKVNNYAKKFIETKFLVWFWEKWEEC